MNLTLILLSLAVTLLLYWILIPRKWQNTFLFIVSLIFIALFSINYAFYFLFNIILVYLGGAFIYKEDKHKKFRLKLLLAWLIGNICFFKYINLLLTGLNKINLAFPLSHRIGVSNIALPLGISYIVFRLIHYTVEIYRRNVPQGNFVNFALYILFFPTFLAGPVDRFQRFYPQTIEDRNLSISNLNQGLLRIIYGTVKKFILADNLGRIILSVLHHPQDFSRLAVILSIYGLAIWIFLDFSGYTDMALGVARLFGYNIMENFNRPLLQKNIADYWRNWHISVYTWIRDYFFYPVFGSHASNIKIYVGIFSSMLLFMLWHKGSLNFLISGIYHGAGLVIWHIFQEIKRKSPRLRALVAKPYLNPVSILFTFSFVSFGFVFFSLDMLRIKSVLGRLIFNF